MPRDKKVIHRATSDVEDEVLSEEEPIDKEKLHTKTSDNSNEKFQDPIGLMEERKKHLKDVILKRTLALKQQRERDRQQRVGSTQRH
jgi:hypothetical protein